MLYKIDAWLNSFELVWTCLNSFELVWTCLKSFELVWTHLSFFELIWTRLNSFELFSGFRRRDYVGHEDSHLRGRRHGHLHGSHHPNHLWTMVRNITYDHNMFIVQATDHKFKGLNPAAAGTERTSVPAVSGWQPLNLGLVACTINTFWS